MKTIIALCLAALAVQGDPSIERLALLGGPDFQRPFTVDDPLGININDVEALNTIPEQVLLHAGFIDVTAPPYSADPTGETDSTQAIQEAVFFARHHKLAVYFPVGDYVVSDSILAMAGWHDERLPNHKYLPWIETWPCVLVGDRRGDRRPRIILAPNSPGFDNPRSPKAVINFNARAISRQNETDPLGMDDGSTNYQQFLYGIDVEVGEGNPGAAVVRFDAAEGASLQDCTFDVGDGFAGVWKGPGSGGIIANVTINGGEIGMLLDSVRPTCTIIGCRFAGQRQAAVTYSQRGPLTLVGCEFLMTNPVPAVISDARQLGSLNMKDCRIEYSDPQAGTAAIQVRCAMYAEDVWVKGGTFLLDSPEEMVPNQTPEKWVHIRYMAASFDGYNEPLTSPIYLDSERMVGVIHDVEAFDESPEVRTQHLWDEATFPYWDSPGTVSVKEAPYLAKGDGVTDDTDAIQRALDENDVVFLPKGAYRITRTLRLRPENKLFGISPSFSMIVPAAVEGGDFTNRDDPQPAIQTADVDESQTVLAFFSVFMPREPGKGVYCLDLRSGNSLVRKFMPIVGYVIADIVPRDQGIFPWTNWEWDQMDEFSLQTGYLHHFRSPFSYTAFGPDTHEGGIPNWPVVRVRDRASGKWYIFVDLDNEEHGLHHRRILVENTKGPFSLYHAQFQYGHGASEMEVRNSENVFIYGIKNERTSRVLWVRNSHNVLLTGVGGPAWLIDSHPKVTVERSTNVRLSGLTPDFKNLSGDHYPFARIIFTDGAQMTTRPHERPALMWVRSGLMAP